MTPLHHGGIIIGVDNNNSSNSRPHDHPASSETTTTTTTADRVVDRIPRPPARHRSLSVLELSTDTNPFITSYYGTTTSSTNQRKDTIINTSSSSSKKEKNSLTKKVVHDILNDKVTMASKPNFVKNDTVHDNAQEVVSDRRVNDQDILKEGRVVNGDRVNNVGVNEYHKPLHGDSHNSTTAASLNYNYDSQPHQPQPKQTQASVIAVEEPSVLASLFPSDSHHSHDTDLYTRQRRRRYSIPTYARDYSPPQQQQQPMDYFPGPLHLLHHDDHRLQQQAISSHNDYEHHHHQQQQQQQQQQHESNFINDYPQTMYHHHQYQHQHSHQQLKAKTGSTTTDQPNTGFHHPQGHHYSLPNRQSTTDTAVNYFNPNPNTNNISPPLLPHDDVDTPLHRGIPVMRDMEANECFYYNEGNNGMKNGQNASSFSDDGIDNNHYLVAMDQSATGYYSDNHVIRHGLHKSNNRQNHSVGDDNDPHTTFPSHFAAMMAPSMDEPDRHHDAKRNDDPTVHGARHGVIQSSNEIYYYNSHHHQHQDPLPPSHLPLTSNSEPTNGHHRHRITTATTTSPNPNGTTTTRHPLLHHQHQEPQPQDERKNHHHGLHRQHPPSRLSNPVTKVAPTNRSHHSYLIPDISRSPPPPQQQQQRRRRPDPDGSSHPSEIMSQATSNTFSRQKKDPDPVISPTSRDQASTPTFFYHTAASSLTLESNLQPVPARDAGNGSAKQTTSEKKEAKLLEKSQQQLEQESQLTEERLLMEQKQQHLLYEHLRQQIQQQQQQQQLQQTPLGQSQQQQRQQHLDEEEGESISSPIVLPGMFLPGLPTMGATSKQQQRQPQHDAGQQHKPPQASPRTNSNTNKNTNTNHQNNSSGENTGRNSNMHRMESDDAVTGSCERSPKQPSGRQLLQEPENDNRHNTQQEQLVEGQQDLQQQEEARRKSQRDPVFPPVRREPPPTSAKARSPTSERGAATESSQKSQPPTKSPKASPKTPPRPTNSPGAKHEKPASSKKPQQQQPRQRQQSNERQHQQPRRETKQTRTRKRSPRPRLHSEESSDRVLWVRDPETKKPSPPKSFRRKASARRRDPSPTAVPPPPPPPFNNTEGEHQDIPDSPGISRQEQRRSSNQTAREAPGNSSRKHHIKRNESNEDAEDTGASRRPSRNRQDDGNEGCEDTRRHHRNHREEQEEPVDSRRERPGTEPEQSPREPKTRKAKQAPKDSQSRRSADSGRSDRARRSPLTDANQVPPPQMENPFDPLFGSNVNGAGDGDVEAGRLPGRTNRISGDQQEVPNDVETTQWVTRDVKNKQIEKHRQERYRYIFLLLICCMLLTAIVVCVAVVVFGNT